MPTIGADDYVENIIEKMAIGETHVVTRRDPDEMRKCFREALDLIDKADSLPFVSPAMRKWLADRKKICRLHVGG